MIEIQTKKMNIDFLIRDSSNADTKTTKEEILEFRIPSPARAGTIQNNEFPGPLISPKHLAFNFTQELLPLAQAEASERHLALNDRFTCQVCSKAYRGKRELTRHMKKHDAPNRFSCSIDGCLQTMYRVDAMRNHIKKHEKRLKAEMERRRDDILKGKLTCQK
jgi:uncharacterized Zn-finger protein